MELKDNYIGNKYKRLTVLSFAYRKEHRAYYNCLCDCGKNTIVAGHCLGHTISCGCTRMEHKGLNAVHGHATIGNISITYLSWYAMIQRCSNPNTIGAKNYINKGISVCDRWNNFIYFLEDMGERPNKKYSLDRIDNNGNYNIENCRWATRKEQANNTNNNTMLLYDGEIYSILELSNKININHDILKTKVYKREHLDGITVIGKRGQLTNI